MHSSEEEEESSDEEAVSPEGEAGQQVEDEDMQESDEDLDDEELEERELQAALASGALKPGLNIMTRVPETRLKFYIDEEALEKKLLDIKQFTPWIERLDMINAPAPLAPELAYQEEEHAKIRKNTMAQAKDETQLDDDPIHNDFKREMMFYRQAQAAVLEAIPRLNSMNIPTRRPEDYFAQMVKSDDHMQKIRGKLLSKQKEEERRQKVRRFRELKKFGKQVQVETEQNKAKARKQLDEKLNSSAREKYRIWTS